MVVDSRKAVRSYII